MEMTQVTVIMRGYNYEQVRTVATVLQDAKHIRNIEVTLNTENAFEIIKKLSAEFGDIINVGAGTVVTFDQLKEAVASGAKFALSPIVMTKEMLDYCNENNIVSIPGAYSASEIYQMYAWGADIIKVFPSNELSVSYAKKVKEPLGDIPLMAVGGVNTKNVIEHFEGGYDYVGTAGGLFNKNDILTQNVEGLKKSLEAFESEVESK